MQVYVQGDQINMAVLFWYLVKSDARVRYYTVAYNGQVTFYKVLVPEEHGHVENLKIFKILLKYL